MSTMNKIVPAVAFAVALTVGYFSLDGRLLPGGTVEEFQSSIKSVEKSAEGSTPSIAIEPRTSANKDQQALLDIVIDSGSISPENSESNNIRNPFNHLFVTDEEVDALIKERTKAMGVNLTPDKTKEVAISLKESLKTGAYDPKGLEDKIRYILEPKVERQVDDTTTTTFPIPDHVFDTSDLTPAVPDQFPSYPQDVEQLPPPPDIAN